jgi:hypothetical protein
MQPRQATQTDVGDGVEADADQIDGHDDLPGDDI